MSTSINQTTYEKKLTGNIFLKVVSITLAMIFLLISLAILATLPGYINGESGKYAIAAMIILFLAAIALIAPYAND